MEDKSERQRKHFNWIADKYYLARRHRNHLLLKDLMWHEILDDKKFLCKKGLRVLEPMCGFADGKAILENVLGVSTIYTGFDYSESVITALKEKQHGLNVSQANVEHFQTDEQFDVIILLGGLHHVPHIAKKVVRQLAGNLAPEGYLLTWSPPVEIGSFPKFEILFIGGTRCSMSRPSAPLWSMNYSKCFEVLV